MIQLDHSWNKKAGPLIWGGALSLALTLVAYFLATRSFLSGMALGVIILGLATIQALCQLIFFFHVGAGKGKGWNKTLLIFALFIAFIVIGGSIWIMANLDYNTMPNM